MVVSKTSLYWGTGVFLVLQVLDIVTTGIGLSIGASEMNPVFAAVQILHSTIAMFFLKGALVGIVLVTIWVLDARYKGKLRITLWAACGYMAFVIGFNSGQLYLLGQL
jgi:hypothetical protein